MSEAMSLALEIFRHELKASEKMTDLFTDFEGGEAEDGIIKAFDRMVDNMEDPDRIRKVVVLTSQMGQGLSSERIVKAAMKVADEHPDLELEGKQTEEV
jgi:hypothetical protein